MDFPINKRHKNHSALGFKVLSGLPREEHRDFPAPPPLSPFSPPDLDRRVDSPALSGRGSRPSGRTSGWGRSHEDIPEVASWVVPHSVGPRFPGPLLIFKFFFILLSRWVLLLSSSMLICPSTSSNQLLCIFLFNCHFTLVLSYVLLMFSWSLSSFFWVWWAFCDHYFELYQVACLSSCSSFGKVLSSFNTTGTYSTFSAFFLLLSACFHISGKSATSYILEGMAL